MAVSTLLFTLIGLAALWWSISLAISLTLALMDRATQYCRDGLAVERINSQARAHQHQLDTLRRKRQGWCFTNLDGRKQWFERDQLEVFARSCWLELGLSGPCSVSELRRHWRRSSLRWHPDQGGDNAAWLRRLRAYEALRQLGRDASARQLVQALPPPLPAVSRRWRWF
jgi:hypothetical protein